MPEKELFDLENLPQEPNEEPVPEEVIDPEDITDPMTPEREKRINFDWENDPAILNARKVLREMPDSHFEDMLTPKMRKALYEHRKRKKIEDHEKK